MEPTDLCTDFPKFWTNISPIKALILLPSFEKVAPSLSSSTTIRHLPPLFIVLLVIAASPTDGVSPRKSGKGHSQNKSVKKGGPPVQKPGKGGSSIQKPRKGGQPVPKPGKGGKPVPKPGKGGLPIQGPGKSGPSLMVPVSGNDIETNFRGLWAIDNNYVGVVAMQFHLMPNNKAVWFDTTSLGPSARELGPRQMPAVAELDSLMANHGARRDTCGPTETWLLPATLEV
ncbi:hypothetical protein E3N88_03824 [Mikania micrantha]|uniref:Uncharacterized protein n=1 Tax=Mikania micrantha TaxID=192012 RepID=A0A5N6PUK4_9ASTR|nr:hypothetical protein E3N88_03824 [Mikania micrantha]